MNNKTFSIISYIGIIGWCIAYFVDKGNRDDLRTYHLKQSFVLMLFGVILSTVGVLVPSTGMALSIGSIFLLVLSILGIINASNGVKKPVPLVGKNVENKFKFLD